MNFEAPLTSLVWLTSIVSVASPTCVVPAPRADARRDTTLWWKLSTIITCGTLAGAIIPELVKVFTSTESGHVKEVVTSRARAARRSTSCPASSRGTSRRTGWAWPSWA
jgi:K(+)-stimulated pyrophosphate-energized sodium pump